MLFQTTVPPKQVDLTEDSLLRHAQFICDQVESFDSAGTDGEVLIVLPCMRTLMRLAGVTLGKRYGMSSQLRRTLRHSHSNGCVSLNL